ncbi:hypothetical protein [Ammoniphilus sp. CFH 90114]|uniref:hypothetical protein n=1 Tax=Ammoniphilus sp. CFH 90114 TaxID=2493665 RepID=UPI00100EA7A5|nr:hypothetical protein [Ammoniphilus sp. CFH 90114]RXT14705.1 hypothetical protein EIZ39_00365 [Ammoniphilus sp. CFH 90114]
MKVSLEQLKRMLATYKLKVLRAQPIDDGYVVETNKGKRVVSVWQNAELLKWSNGWREQLFTQGYGAVERFLSNGNNKKYIRFQGKYFVLTEALDGRVPDPLEEQDCLKTGEIFADYHRAIDRIDHGASQAKSSAFDENFFSDGSTTIKQVMQRIEQKHEPSLVDEVIYSNLPLLYKRFRRASQLWDGVKEAVAYFPLSLEKFKLDQIIHTENGWQIRGGYNQGLAPIHEDTVCLIRHLYQRSDWNLSMVTSFLDGYERKRELSDNELVYILVQLALPSGVWEQFNHYLTTNELNEEQIHQLAEAIRIQRYWDELALQVGRYIDQRRKATA